MSGFFARFTTQTLLVAPLVALAFIFLKSDVSLPWGSGSVRYFSLAVVVTIAYFCISWKALPIYLTSVLGFSFLIVLLGHGMALGAFFAFWFLSVVVGIILLGESKSLKELLLPSMLVGAGVVGSVVGLMAHFHINSQLMYLIFTFSCLAFLKQTTTKVFSEVLEAFSQKSEGRLDFSHYLLFLITAIHLVFSIMPESGADALVFHLYVSKTLEFNRQWAFDPSLYVFSLIPMLGDWIFAYGSMLGGQIAAKLINLSFTLLMAALIYRMARLLRVDFSYSRVAAAIFLSLPTSFLETNSLFVEGVWGCFILLFAMQVLTILNTRNVSASQMYIMALSIGFALSTKVITVEIVPILALPLLYKWKYFNQIQIKCWIISGLLLIILGLHTYIYAFVISGNPVFPFFNALFKSTYYPLVNFDNWLFRTSLSWRFPFDCIVNADKYIEGSFGAGGFQFLLLLPAAIFSTIVAKNWRLLALFIAIVFAAWLIFSSQSYLRYIYPLFALVTLFLVVSLFALIRVSGSLVKIAVIICFSINFAFLTSASWCYRSVPLYSTMANSTDAYYVKHVPVMKPIQLVNVINTEKAGVALFMDGTYGATLNSVAYYPHWYNYKFQDALFSNDNGVQVKGYFYQNNIRYFILDSEWKSKDRVNLLLQDATQVYDFGRFSVWKVKDGVGSVELLKSPNFENPNDWYIAGEPSFDQNSNLLKVSQTDNYSQHLVLTKRSYLFEMESKCLDNGAQVRLQVNWLNEKREFIEASNSVDNCSEDWKIFSSQVTAPSSARYAFVYISAFDKKFIQVKRVSFK